MWATLMSLAARQMVLPARVLRAPVAAVDTGATRIRSRARAPVARRLRALARRCLDVSAERGEGGSSPVMILYGGKERTHIQWF